MRLDFVVDDEKDAVVHVTGVSISTSTGLAQNDSERDTREDKEGSSDEEKPAGG